MQLPRGGKCGREGNKIKYKVWGKITSVKGQKALTVRRGPLEDKETHRNRVVKAYLSLGQHPKENSRRGQKVVPSFWITTKENIVQSCSLFLCQLIGSNLDICQQMNGKRCGKLIQLLKDEIMKFLGKRMELENNQHEETERQTLLIWLLSLH